jgi:hypothetical protein
MLSDAWRGWISAASLELGEQIPQRDGDVDTVRSIEVVQRTQRMYNLKVAVAHTFFVGDEQWLVHNARICPTRFFICWMII